ncbi:Bug family tripartite tricarboxylate transporter substrate binding protein [Variovorax sp. RA8]|uniref:Bug family tripartite tricarboxylate transporter substrate binding protein n=1 Tax=Variovorax sp. (strain JCM 16519 / RA8) TaxID=662548 RepID=UPI0013199D82|nr:tripartite tricarboxylate transporter substrate binding protein [Variovorax sp. RA8]VTU19611.1 Argininosuccinate lyase [Variovorax sp. RA8]
MHAALFDPRRRSALAGGAAALALAMLGGRAQAQAWPSKPVRLLLGYTPGGSADITARELAVPLGKLLGQPLVVDYKPGASGTIAAAEVARSAPDGYTLGLLDNAPLTIVPALRNPGYDPVSAFTPIAMATQLPQVLVVPAATGIRSTRELIEAMRKEPGKLSYASGGTGSVGHLAGELLKLRTGTFAVHVPYRGGAPAITALAAGDVQFAFLTYTATSSFIASGRLRAIGVSSLQRLPAMPDVPTIVEGGVPNFDAPGWFALMGPAGMPPEVTATLRKAVAEVLATPAVVTRMEALGQSVVTGKAEAARTIANELAMWKQLVAQRKIVIDG